MCTLERPEAVSAAMRKWFLSVIASETAHAGAGVARAAGGAGK
jgi:hypothetical protein